MVTLRSDKKTNAPMVKKSAGHVAGICWMLSVFAMTVSCGESQPPEAKKDKTCVVETWTTLDVATELSRCELATVSFPRSALSTRDEQKLYAPSERFRVISISPQDVVVGSSRKQVAGSAALSQFIRQLATTSMEPELSRLPQAWRMPFEEEVLVQLRTSRGDRLWRSAKGATLGEALMRAMRHARKRWQEVYAPANTWFVDVLVLREEGDLIELKDADLSLAVSTTHGVGFEGPKFWRYRLPAERSDETPQASFRALFSKHQLDYDSDHRRFRLYRFSTQSVASVTVELSP